MGAADFAYLDARRPIGLAHRGGAKLAANVGLENSLAAFRGAVELGYRYLETDVHATADGVVLAIHDSSLERVSTGEGRVEDLSYAAVRQARINGTEEIPRLSDLLEEFPEARFNIDVKAASALEPLAAVIRSHAALRRVCVGSFSDRRLRVMRRLLGPELATAAGPSEVAALKFAPRMVAAWLRSPAPVLQIPTGHVIGGRRLDLVTPGLVQRAHLSDKHLHVWTIDDAQEMHRLFDLGVDGIVSDRIDTLAGVLAERGVPLGR
ncbi:MAG TPA: glycerophosphodiester phosphodiesterase family protein [Pedococcus sp.]|nr:glycerophosphodiester phosphodiesterase family protein [Pedococcus sp.]